MSYKLIFRTLHLTLVFFALTFAVSAEIKYKEVTSTGIGQSYEEALNNAFAEAISMVNGKNIQTRTIIQVLGGESIPKNNADTNTMDRVRCTIHTSCCVINKHIRFLSYIAT